MGAFGADSLLVSLRFAPLRFCVVFFPALRVQKKDPAPLATGPFLLKLLLVTGFGFAQVGQELLHLVGLRSVGLELEVALEVGYRGSVVLGLSREAS